MAARPVPLLFWLSLLLGSAGALGCGNNAPHEEASPPQADSGSAGQEVPRDSGPPEPAPLTADDRPAPKGPTGDDKLQLTVQRIQAGKSKQFDTREFPKLTDADLATLKGAPRLVHLTLDNAPITDAGLAHLAGLSTLRTLSVSNTRITDAGLAHVSGLSELEFLRLDQDRLTDDGLVHLEGLRGLKRLSLWKVPITDKGLIHLRALVSLENLSLDETAVTDEGVKELVAVLPNLKYLSVWKTKVTAEAVTFFASRKDLKVNR
jgi:hypothetical protein